MTTGKDERSLSVSAVVKQKDNYVFVIREPDLWEKDADGRIILPFGTIESRIRKGEDAAAALERKFREETGADVKILNSQTSHFIYNGAVDEVSVTAKSNRPLFIYKNEEEKKKKYSYVFSFLATADNIETVLPRRKPAIILMNKKLLNKAVKGKLSLRELKARGGKIISNMELPEDAVLAPTPAPRGIYLCCGNCR